MIIDVIAKKLNEILNYDITFRVIKSNRSELCDYQSDDIFKLAKSLKMNPIELGTKIVEEINQINDFNQYFEKVEFAPPGFINISVSDLLINQTLEKMNNEDKFGLKEPEKIENFILDYGGYNIAKPLHIGHLRPTIIGESIKRIIKYMGHNVVADVHLGDFGLQMGQVIYGIKRDNIMIEDIDISYLNKIYPEISGLCKIDENIKEECIKITKDLQNGDLEYQSIWKKIYEVSICDAKSICNYLGVNFDLWQGESDANEYLEQVEELLKQKNLLEVSDGALVVNVKKDTDNKPMPPMMFKKSNGAYLYDSTDLATIYERKQRFNPDHIIYVTDFRQNLHFEQVFRASDLADIIPYHALEHAYNGTINGTDGKPFKTRKGDAPRLSELFDMVKATFISLKETNQEMSERDLDIIVNAIVKFADLGNARDKDYIFDITKFSNVVGKTGPYILYTYLRINKILEKEEFTETLSNQIYNETDHNLRLKITEFNLALENAFKERKPNYIADYIYNLAVTANNFYQNNYILTEENKIKKNDWLFVLHLANKLLKQLLELILIEIPSVM